MWSYQGDSRRSKEEEEEEKEEEGGGRRGGGGGKQEDFKAKEDTEEDRLEIRDYRHMGLEPKLSAYQPNVLPLKIGYFTSHLIFLRFLTFNYCLCVLFRILTKSITPTICRLCVCVLINKRSFQPTHKGVN